MRERPVPVPVEEAQPTRGLVLSEIPTSGELEALTSSELLARMRSLEDWKGAAHMLITTEELDADPKQRSAVETRVAELVSELVKQGKLYPGQEYVIDPLTGVGAWLPHQASSEAQGVETTDLSPSPSKGVPKPERVISTEHKLLEVLGFKKQQKDLVNASNGELIAAAQELAHLDPNIFKVDVGAFPHDLDALTVEDLTSRPDDAPDVMRRKIALRKELVDWIAAETTHFEQREVSGAPELSRSGAPAAVPPTTEAGVPPVPPKAEGSTEPHEPSETERAAYQARVRDELDHLPREELGSPEQLAANELLGRLERQTDPKRIDDLRVGIDKNLKRMRERISARRGTSTTGESGTAVVPEPVATEDLETVARSLESLTDVDEIRTGRKRLVLMYADLVLNALHTHSTTDAHFAEPMGITLMRKIVEKLRSTTEMTEQTDRLAELILEAIERNHEEITRYGIVLPPLPKLPAIPETPTEPMSDAAAEGVVEEPPAAEPTAEPAAPRLAAETAGETKPDVSETFETGLEQALEHNAALPNADTSSADRSVNITYNIGDGAQVGVVAHEGVHNSMIGIAAQPGTAAGVPAERTEPSVPERVQQTSSAPEAVTEKQDAPTALPAHEPTPVAEPAPETPTQPKAVPAGAPETDAAETAPTPPETASDRTGEEAAALAAPADMVPSEAAGESVSSPGVTAPEATPAEPTPEAAPSDPYQQTRAEYHEFTSRLREAGKEYQAALMALTTRRNELGLLKRAKNAKELVLLAKVRDEKEAAYDALLGEVRTKRTERVTKIVEAVKARRERRGDLEEAVSRDPAAHILAWHEAILYAQTMRHAATIEQLQGVGAQKEHGPLVRRMQAVAEYYRKIPLANKLTLRVVGAGAIGAGAALLAAPTAAAAAFWAGGAAATRAGVGFLTGMGAAVGTKKGLDSVIEKRAARKTGELKKDFAGKHLADTRKQLLAIRKQERQLKTGATVVAGAAAFGAGATAGQAAAHVVDGGSLADAEAYTGVPRALGNLKRAADWVDEKVGLRGVPETPDVAESEVAGIPETEKTASVSEPSVQPEDAPISEPARSPAPEVGEQVEPDAQRAEQPEANPIESRGVFRPEGTLEVRLEDDSIMLRDPSDPRVVYTCFDSGRCYRTTLNDPTAPGYRNSDGPQDSPEIEKHELPPAMRERVMRWDREHDLQAALDREVREGAIPHAAPRSEEGRVWLNDEQMFSEVEPQVGQRTPLAQPETALQVGAIDTTYAQGESPVSVIQDMVRKLDPSLTEEQVGRVAYRLFLEIQHDGAAQEAFNVHEGKWNLVRPGSTARYRFDEALLERELQSVRGTPATEPAPIEARTEEPVVLREKQEPARVAAPEPVRYRPGDFPRTPELFNNLENLGQVPDHLGAGTRPALEYLFSSGAWSAEVTALRPRILSAWGALSQVPVAKLIDETPGAEFELAGGSVRLTPETEQLLVVLSHQLERMPGARGLLEVHAAAGGTFGALLQDIAREQSGVAAPPQQVAPSIRTPAYKPGGRMGLVLRDPGRVAVEMIADNRQQAEIDRARAIAASRGYEHGRGGYGRHTPLVPGRAGVGVYGEAVGEVPISRNGSLRIGGRAGAEVTVQGGPTLRAPGAATPEALAQVEGDLLRDLRSGWFNAPNLTDAEITRFRTIDTISAEELALYTPKAQQALIDAGLAEQGEALSRYMRSLMRQGIDRLEANAAAGVRRAPGYKVVGGPDASALSPFEYAHHMKGINARDLPVGAARNRPLRQQGFGIRRGRPYNLNQ